MKNYYDVLGVKSNATADEIKRAYRKLASQHHPDKGGDVKKFQEIEEAYRILSDPDQRQRYDNPSAFTGFGSMGSDGFQPFNFDTIFDIFGARFNQGHQRRPQMARMTLWISLEDAARGGTRTISVGTPSGTTAVDIDIPVGIDDGDNVQYPGVAPGGIDLVIGFRIHPNPRWRRNGLNLFMDQTVTVWDLVLGRDIVIRDILGREISVNIPPQTQPDTVLRLKGQGMPHRSGQRGDILIRVQARLPDTIAPEIIEAIRQNQ